MDKHLSKLIYIFFISFKTSNKPTESINSYRYTFPGSYGTTTRLGAKKEKSTTYNLCFADKILSNIVSKLFFHYSIWRIFSQDSRMV